MYSLRPENRISLYFYNSRACIRQKTDGTCAVFGLYLAVELLYELVSGCLCCASVSTVFTLPTQCPMATSQTNLLPEMQTGHGTVCPRWVSRFCDLRVRKAPFTLFLPCDTILTRYMLSSCVFLSVCVSVTRWYCIKMAKLRIMQTMPHNSAETSFLTNFLAKFEGVTPNGGDRCRYGRLK